MELNHYTDHCQREHKQPCGMRHCVDLRAALAQRDDVIDERDEALARAEKAEADTHEAVMALAKERAGHAPDPGIAALARVVGKLEAARDELGIQLAAQSERLRLAMAVVDVARNWADEVFDLRRTIAALDRAHEASGVVVTGAPFDEPSNGVKGVE